VERPGCPALSITDKQNELDDGRLYAGPFASIECPPKLLENGWSRQWSDGDYLPVSRKIGDEQRRIPCLSISSTVVTDGKVGAIPAYPISCRFWKTEWWCGQLSENKSHFWAFPCVQGMLQGISAEFDRVRNTLMRKAVKIQPPTRQFPANQNREFASHRRDFLACARNAVVNLLPNPQCQPCGLAPNAGARWKDERVTDRTAIPLADSWKAFWSLVSPGDESWKVGLARVIKANMVNYSQTELHVTPLAGEPPWAQSVEVSCEPGNIKFTIAGGKFECAFDYSRLFLKPSLQEMPRSSLNPFMQLASLPSDRLPGDCTAQAKLLITDVLIRTGKRIEATIAAALKSGRLQAVGASAADNFRTSQTLTPMQAQVLGPINLSGSDLIARTGATILFAVQLIALEDAVKPVGRHNFELGDIELCKAMHAMIKQEGISIVAAATRVEPQARRRKAKVENVIQRLQRRYQRARDTGELA
jgi:hypothetical protein